MKAWVIKNGKQYYDGGSYLLSLPNAKLYSTKQDCLKAIAKMDEETDEAVRVEIKEI